MGDLPIVALVPLALLIVAETLVWLRLRYWRWRLRGASLPPVRKMPGVVRAMPPTAPPT